MSPRRRLLVQSCLVVVVVVAATFALSRLLSDSAVHAGRLPPPQDAPGPVLLVPGFGGSTTSLGVLAARLRAEGRQVEIVALPGDGTGDLREQADVLESAVDRALDRSPDAQSVDLVGYSAGGVVVRVWLDDHDGTGRARRIVTLGSPHHGTDIAGAAIAIAPSACPAACQQLAPGSPLLRELNEGDETPDGPSFVSVWTAQDQTVTPPQTARLDGAVDVPLQSVCADAVVSHGRLPSDPLPVGVVVRALGAAPVPSFSAADCTALRADGAPH